MVTGKELVNKKNDVTKKIVPASMVAVHKVRKFLKTRVKYLQTAWDGCKDDDAKAAVVRDMKELLQVLQNSSDDLTALLDAAESANKYCDNEAEEASEDELSEAGEDEEDEMREDLRALTGNDVGAVQSDVGTVSLPSKEPWNKSKPDLRIAEVSVENDTERDDTPACNSKKRDAVQCNNDVPVNDVKTPHRKRSKFRLPPKH